MHGDVPAAARALERGNRQIVARIALGDGIHNAAGGVLIADGERGLRCGRGMTVNSRLGPKGCKGLKSLTASPIFPQPVHTVTNRTIQDFFTAF